MIHCKPIMAIAQLPLFFFLNKAMETKELTPQLVYYYLYSVEELVQKVLT